MNSPLFPFLPIFRSLDLLLLEVRMLASVALQTTYVDGGGMGTGRRSE